MQMYGYSERGALNTLFNEIAYSKKPEALLSSLLRLARFPLRQQDSASVIKATILLEQSLSDFGDADAILLLDTTDGPAAVFLEAKVKPSQTREWTIQQEYQKFIDGLASTVSSSNLFTQLYHKVRFVEALRQGCLDRLQKGILFPKSSTRQKRKIGHNEVVIKAVKMIKPYLKKVSYLSIIPDSPDRVSAFFESTLAKYVPPGYECWDIRDYGYLTWSEIEKFCRDQDLANTCRVFEFNKDQIY